MVPDGYYSIAVFNNATFSYKIQECERGSYCISGVKSPCAAGTYGAVTGLSSPLCSGLCLPGYFCPPNSTMSTSYNCNDGYDDGGKYGATSANCDGPCPAGYRCNKANNIRRLPCGNATVYCPMGTSSPIKVSPGFYSTPLTSAGSSRSSQSLCDVGYYCKDGIRYPCPAGTYGDQAGLRTSRCSGLARPGK